MMNLFDYLYYRSHLETGRRRGTIRVPACVPVVIYAFLYAWMLGRVFYLFGAQPHVIGMAFLSGCIFSACLLVYYLVRGKAIVARGDELREAGEPRYAAERRVMTHMLIGTMALIIVLFEIFG